MRGWRFLISTNLLDFSGTLLFTALVVLTDSVDGFEARDGSTILRISFFCFSASMISALNCYWYSQLVELIDKSISNFSIIFSTLYFITQGETWYSYHPWGKSGGLVGVHSRAMYFFFSYLFLMKVSICWSDCGRLKSSGNLASYTALPRLFPICCIL